MDDFKKLIELFKALPKERQQLLLKELERESNGETNSRRNRNLAKNDSGKVIKGYFPPKKNST